MKQKKKQLNRSFSGACSLGGLLAILLTSSATVPSLSARSASHPSRMFLDGSGAVSSHVLVAQAATMPPAGAVEGSLPTSSIAGELLLSVRLVPEDVTLQGAWASQQFLLLGTYADGLDRDITSQSRLSIFPSQVASVDREGKVIARANGQAVLRAEMGDKVAQSFLHIESIEQQRPFHFAREIGGVLTRQGCNSTDCHGGVKGRGGLKLSLNALCPEEDHRWIVEGGSYQVLVPDPKEPIQPRVNLEKPEKSLLLMKSTGAVPHGGGRRLVLGSPEYHTLLEWVGRGAPYGEEGAEVVRVEVFPREVFLYPGERHQLLVTAYLSDGSREDVTDRVSYVMNNSRISQVSQSGTVIAVESGETDVVIRAVGHTTTALIGVIGRRLVSYPELPKRNFIDDHVFAKLKKLHILSSELASDEEFLRRVCLDLTGTLPPPERAREFLASRDPQKREKLIEVLLNTPEYIDYWTFRFTDFFRVGEGVMGLATGAYWQWLRDSIARNKPYDEIARQRIAATGYDGPSRHFQLYSKEPPIEQMMAEQVRVFMGRRLDCAQCHDHPFENWSQDQFWGLAAFFGGLKMTLWNQGFTNVVFDDPEGHEIDYGVDGEISTDKDPVRRLKHPRTKKVVDPAFFDGRLLPAHKRMDPRLELAKWMTSHSYFAEAIVNRVWGCFFGRGIVDPVDDFQSANPPTHPALLETLAEDFRKNGHDLKRLMRTIVQSRTYQLSGIPNQTNQDDRTNYSHSLPRGLDAEVLLDAICQVTGVPEVFESEPEGVLPVGTRAIHLKAPAAWPSRFLDIYGRPLRESVPERDNKPALAQALHMVVGSTFSEKLSAEGGRLQRLLARGATDQEIIEELYLSALTRLPIQEEKTKLEGLISRQPSRLEAFEHLLWALLSSRPFAHNN